MSSVEEIRNGLLECVEKAKEVNGMSLMCAQMSAELRALLAGLWGAGAPPSPDFTDMQALALRAREDSEHIRELMQEFVGKALDYSSRL